MKISIIVGTRPEIIKMSPIMKLCEKNKCDYFIIHTGQHYSYEMDAIFFEELGLPKVKYNIEIGSGLHGLQTGKMLEKLEKILIEEKADIVLLHGDTNTTLAGSLAAVKLCCKIGHVEAGLRSFNKAMPEEVNRTIVDHISDYLFVPSEKTKGFALREGISETKIFIVGNTIVDAVYENIENAEKESNILAKLQVEKDGYFLLTTHRDFNVDNKAVLQEMFEGFKLISNEFKVPIIFPVHPRTKKMIEEFRLRIPENLRMMAPVGFFDFLVLEKNAKLVLTDSGGVIEECCIFKVPCVTLRNDTERWETVDVGANILVGTNPQRILDGCREMIKRKREWENPYGDGKTGERILDILLNS